MVDPDSIHMLKNQIDQLRRQRDDLQAANNRYLARARKAEADLRWWRDGDIDYFRDRAATALRNMADAELKRAETARKSGNRFETNLCLRAAERLDLAREYVKDSF